MYTFAVKTPLLVVVAFASISGGMLSAHRHADAWAPPPEAEDEIRYLPSGDSLRAMSLGFEEVLADLLWVKAVLLFGERYGDGDESWYPWMFHMTDLATELDPQFRAAYKMGGTMLRTDGVFVDQSNLIFQKGMNAMPDEWYFPFSIGMNYFLSKKDPAVAATFIRRASEAPGSPLYLRNLAASLLSDSHQLEVALQFLLEDAQVLPPGPARQVTWVKIYEIRYGIARRDAKAAIEAYRAETGHLPSEPQDIIAAGFELPADPMADTTGLAELSEQPSPPAETRWIWDPDPEAMPSDVVSSGFQHVFAQIVAITGYGSRRTQEQ